MKARLDLLWEEFRLPIWATEFDWNWHQAADFGDHSYHAEVLDSFYRLMFSHQVKLTTALVLRSDEDNVRLLVEFSVGHSILSMLTTHQTKLDSLT